MDGMEIRRILVPTDFSETADAALARAAAMAKALAAEVVIVHVNAPILVLPPPVDLVSIPAVFPDALRRQEEALEERAARIREAGVACETAMLEGSPATEIVRHAADVRADMIVIGTHGRGGVAHAVLGSVAERVVHRSHCPVLVVPVRKR